MEAITKEKLVEDLKTVGHDVEDLVKATANRTDERRELAPPRVRPTSTSMIIHGRCLAL